MEVKSIQPTFCGKIKYISKRMPKEVLAEKQAHIFSLYKQGKNKGEIAKEIGVSLKSLSVIWNRLKIDELIKSSFISAINEGKSRDDIIKEFHISLPTYYNMAKMYDVPLTMNKKLLQRKDELLELRAQGKTKVQMAEILGVTPGALTQFMEELGINTLSKDRILDMTKGKLIELKKRYKSVNKIGKVTHISNYAIIKLFEYFNIKR